MDNLSDSTNLIAYSNGQDINILNNDGYCVASSDDKKIGSKISLESKEGSNSCPIDFSGDKKTTLFYDGIENEKEMVLIKSLAKLTLEHYYNSISKPIGTLDQYIAQVIERPFDTDRLKIFESQAQSFGLNLNVNRVAIVIEMENFTENNLSQPTNMNYTHEDIIHDWRNRIVSAVSGFFTIKTDIIAAYTGSDRFILFKEIDGNVEKFAKSMKSAFGSIFGPLSDLKKNNLSVGFSLAHNGVNGLFESYHEALQALRLGRKFISNDIRCYYYGDLGSLRILTEDDINKKKTFANEILEPLSKETLRSTLETFLNENMDIKKTAQKLKIHPNTVNYRLSKIAEHLNLDPRIFKQAFELRIALLTDKIFD